MFHKSLNLFVFRILNGGLNSAAGLNSDQFTNRELGNGQVVEFRFPWSLLGKKNLNNDVKKHYVLQNA